MSELWRAVESLTAPTRERLERDHGPTQWVELPSLFDQLVEAVQTGRGGTGRGKQGSRPPLDIACVSLLIEISEAVADAMRSYDRKRTYDTPKDLRSVASSVVADPDGDQDWWTAQIRTWCGKVRNVISSDPDRSWRLHGIACPECATTHIKEQQDGETLRRPVIEVIWAQGLVRAITCLACEANWYRGADLEALAERLLGRQAHTTEVAI